MDESAKAVRSSIWVLVVVKDAAFLKSMLTSKSPEIDLAMAAR